MDAVRGRSRSACIALLLLAVTAWAGCGWIADKNRIKIAKIKGQFITRGDLSKILRDMPDDERPNIRNKGDLLHVLNEQIDAQIKAPLIAEVEAKIKKNTLVPREAAMQQYFKEHAEDDYASMYTLQNPETVGLSKAQYDILKQEIDLGIDRVLEKLNGEAAVIFKAMELTQQGTLTVTDAEYEKEYRLRKSEMKKLEWMEFRAIRFAADAPDSETSAATVRKRLEAGEKFDALFDEYKAKDPNSVIQSEIENNPTLEKFRGFWLNASGSEPGAIIGPVYLPGYQVMSGRTDAQGRAAVVQMPAAYLVLEVLQHKPETELTLEEAKKQLDTAIRVAKTMDLLRKQDGVEIYDKMLPDPSLFTDEFNKPVGAL